MHVQMDVPLLVAVEAFQLFYSIQASRISSELNKELNFCQLQDCKQRKEIVVRATDLIYLQLYFLVPFLVFVKMCCLTELKWFYNAHIQASRAWGFFLPVMCLELTKSRIRKMS